MNISVNNVGAKAQRSIRDKWWHFHALMGQVLLLLVAVSITLLLGVTAAPEKWEKKISRLVWVAYSPSTADPNKNIEATPESIRADLAVLRKAGFTGLVTYSSSGVLGRELPALAQSLGFEGVILGVWDPANEHEVSAAKAGAKAPIVLGLCAGNEGLQQRYKFSALSAAIQDLKKTTGKPVTTTEVIEKYSDDSLLLLGDWVFPNAHPFFHSQLDPDAAVRWTKGAFDDFRSRTGRFVMFKEVGLPTAGDWQRRLSEEAQAQYYLKLAKADVRFVYFEAFDQTWKTHLPVEPHWGIFQSDRAPKRLGQRLMERERLPQSVTEPPFYVYKDIDDPNNHYKPTGFMGDIGDLHVDDAFEGQPHSGKTCIRVVYEAKGKGPSSCDYTPPCKWAGLYWQEPPNNWGRNEAHKGMGINLSHYNRLVFWARADQESTIEFKVGGINEVYGDSLVYPRSKRARLSKTWQEFEIDLKGADLKHIIGGFCLATNWDTNPQGITIYLDDIRFEKK